MFWLKTHGCTVFLLLQLVVRFELKSVLRTDDNDNDDDDIGENLESSERKELIDETQNMDKDKIDIEKEDPEINRIKKKVDNAEGSKIPSNFASMKNSKIIKKLVKDETEIRDRDTKELDDEDEDDLKSVESQESVHEVKKQDEDADEENSSNGKTKKIQIANKKVAKVEEFGIPNLNGSAMNKTKKISPSKGKNKDYALDDFWADQPVDFYHYYQFTTPRPTTAAPTPSSKPTTQVEREDYALDDFWEEQPFDFYHYYQQYTTPRPTTAAPTPYYNEYYEYKDAYDYNRDYSPADEKALLKQLNRMNPVSSPLKRVILYLSRSRIYV